jgi:transaldolase
VTSNPSIFEKALLESDDYLRQLPDLSERDLDAMAMYECLAIADVQSACDVLRGTRESSSGQDGFVSLEIAANLAS